MNAKMLLQVREEINNIMSPRDYYTKSYNWHYAALLIDSSHFKNIPDPLLTEEMCEIGVKKDTSNFEYVPHKSKKEAGNRL